jgi:hypothetical protein
MTLKKSQKRMKEIGREEKSNARDRLWFRPFLGWRAISISNVAGAGAEHYPAEIGMSITGLPAGL